MGCGCNKNKKPNNNNEQNTNSNPIAFRNVAPEPVKKEGILNKMSMVKSFAGAIVSRGVNDKKTNPPTKQLRVLSCFGNSDRGGELTPCEHLKKSTTEGKHYCGGCGCGDKPHTWLMANGENYSKLDYPRLNCPLNMPGFSNYQPSAPDEASEPITRRYYIENIDFNEVLKTPITLPDNVVPQQNEPKKEETDIKSDPQT